MKNTLYVWSFLAFFLFATGCKGKRSESTESINISGELIPMIELAQMATGDSCSWRDIYMPFKIDITSPMGFTANGRATFIKDEAIMLSIRVMGIEGAQIYFNQDSLFFVDKYHKMYVAESTRNVLGSLDLTISDLQSLLLGRPFAPQGMLEQISWAMPQDELPALQMALFDLSGDAESLFDENDTVVPDAPQLNFFYFNYADTEYGSYPTVVDFELMLPNIEAKAGLMWDFGNAKWDSGREIKFSVPKNCRQIPLSALVGLKM